MSLRQYLLRLFRMQGIQRHVASEDIEVDCGEVFSGVSGEISAERCERDAALGTCEVEVSAITSTVTFYYGETSGSLRVCAIAFLAVRGKQQKGKNPLCRILRTLALRWNRWSRMTPSQYHLSASPPHAFRLSQRMSRGFGFFRPIRPRQPG